MRSHIEARRYSPNYDYFHQVFYRWLGLPKFDRLIKSQSVLAFPKIIMGNWMALSQFKEGIAAGRLSPAEYAQNFSDLHPPLDNHEALVEADRCYFCYD